MAQEETDLKRNAQQYISRANVFTDSFIKDHHRGSYDLRKYVGRYEEEIRPIIADAICSRIITKISLQNYKTLLKGLDSLKQYFSTPKFDEMKQRIRGICEEYDSKKEENYNILYGKREEPIRDNLSRRGISGDAIVVNVEASPEWDEVLNKLDSTYDQLLNNVKESLSEVFY